MPLLGLHETRGRRGQRPEGGGVKKFPIGSYQDVRAIDAVKDALKQPEADNA